MKKTVLKSFLIITMVAGAAAMGWADSCHQGESMHTDGRKGVMIHESAVDGYQFMYHLIDMTGHMKDMPEMKNTHHLMVYVKSPHGHMVENAKVGYLLKDGEGASQKAMAMAMSGGYGADVNFMKKGKFIIKTKIMDGSNTVMDEFAYEVK